jgi:hypothetical protein
VIPNKPSISWSPSTMKTPVMLVEVAALRGAPNTIVGVTFCVPML